LAGLEHALPAPRVPPTDLGYNGAMKHVAVIAVAVLAYGCKRPAPTTNAVDAEAASSAASTGSAGDAAVGANATVEDAATAQGCNRTRCSDTCACGVRSTCTAGVCVRDADWKVLELAVSEGGTFGCARYANGHIACAGENEFGQLGRGIDLASNPELTGKKNIPPSEVPQQRDVSQIVTGSAGACDLRMGAVWCWGFGGAGELGMGAFRSDPSPQLVLHLTDAKSIASGYSHTCAIEGSGVVVCWGKNDKGQLGDGTYDNRAEPVAVRGVTHVKQIAVGAHHSCALLASGGVTCWGGLGGAAGAATSIAGLAGVEEITSMRDGMCVRTGQTVKCWGPAFGRAPTHLKELDGARRIAGGATMVCAIVANGQMKCAEERDVYFVTSDDDKKRVTPRSITVGGKWACAVRSDEMVDCIDELPNARAIEQL
jgi:hypothetical protein